MKFKGIQRRHRKNFCHPAEFISIFIHTEKDSPEMIESVSENAFGTVSVLFYGNFFFFRTVTVRYARTEAGEIMLSSLLILSGSLRSCFKNIVYANLLNKMLIIDI